MKERSFLPAADVARVRKKIAGTAEAALAKLAVELTQFGVKQRGNKRVLRRLPESWVKNFKAVADQLRRDYRLDGEGEDSRGGAETRSDPLDGIKLADTG